MQQLSEVQVRQAEDDRREVSRSAREGEVVERRSRRGKTFYGCNRYPECDFVAWGKPIPEQCPNCSNPYLIEKWLKAGPVAQCPNPECKYKRDLPKPAPEEALADSSDYRFATTDVRSSATGATALNSATAPVTA